MRAVIYARYSSDQQREASIEDQIRVCERRIEREGWALLHCYADRALSGASRLRPGYQKLLEDARAGAFDVVVSDPGRSGRQCGYRLSTDVPGCLPGSDRRDSYRLR